MRQFFLVPYLGNDEKQFVKFGRVFVVISLVATVVIILLYDIRLGWG